MRTKLPWYKFCCSGTRNPFNIHHPTNWTSHQQPHYQQFSANPKHQTCKTAKKMHNLPANVTRGTPSQKHFQTNLPCPTPANVGYPYSSPTSSLAMAVHTRIQVRVRFYRESQPRNVLAGHRILEISGFLIGWVNCRYIGLGGSGYCDSGLRA